MHEPVKSNLPTENKRMWSGGTGSGKESRQL